MPLRLVHRAVFVCFGIVQVSLCIIWAVGSISHAWRLDVLSSGSRPYTFEVYSSFACVVDRLPSVMHRGLFILLNRELICV